MIYKTETLTLIFENKNNLTKLIYIYPKGTFLKDNVDIYDDILKCSKCNLQQTFFLCDACACEQYINIITPKIFLKENNIKLKNNILQVVGYMIYDIIYDADGNEDYYNEFIINNIE